MRFFRLPAIHAKVFLIKELAYLEAANIVSIIVGVMSFGKKP